MKMTLPEKAVAIRLVLNFFLGCALACACALLLYSCDGQIRIRIEITDEPAKEAK